jgi:hypothetical protein
LGRKDKSQFSDIPFGASGAGGFAVGLVWRGKVQLGARTAKVEGPSIGKAQPDAAEWR